MTFSINDTKRNNTSTVIMSVIMLNVAFYFCHYSEISYAECHYAEQHYAECRHGECHYAVRRYAECRYAECRYAECRGVHKQNKLYVLSQPKNPKQVKLLSMSLASSWQDFVPFYALKSGTTAFSITILSINNKQTLSIRDTEQNNT